MSLRSSREVSIDTRGLKLPAETQVEKGEAAFRALQLARRIVNPHGIPNPSLRTEIEIFHSTISHTNFSLDDKLAGKSDASVKFTDPKTGIKWTAGAARLPIPGNNPFLVHSLEKPAMFELQREQSRSYQDSIYRNITRVDMIVMDSTHSIIDLIGVNFEELRHFEYHNRLRDANGRFLEEMPPTLEGLKINHSNDYATLVRTEALLREFRQALLSA